MKYRSKMVDFKQSSVAKYVGIKVDDSKLHDADYDIEICIKIYNFITNLLAK